MKCSLKRQLLPNTRLPFKVCKLAKVSLEKLVYKDCRALGAIPVTLITPRQVRVKMSFLFLVILRCKQTSHVVGSGIVHIT